MSTKLPWHSVECRLLDEVFPGVPREEVQRTADFLDAGVLDSLAIVLMIEVLADCAGTDRVIDLATTSNFRNLDAVRGFYESL